jgi:ketosteroid isomerase-like protein
MPQQTDAGAVVAAFNDAIDGADLEGLADLMADAHIFIDAAGGRVAGKAACVAAWRQFFAAFPDYRNDFERIVVKGDVVFISGRSSCSDPRLNGPALWRALVRGALIVEWQVYTDTDENRASLGLV